MRASQILASSILGSLVLAAAGGCAGTSGLGAAAPSALRPSQAMAMRAARTPAQMLELQIAGKLPAPVPADVLRRQLQDQGRPRPEPVIHAGGRIALWATDTNFNYLLGQDATGRNTVTAVDLSTNSCYSPIALKVDHTQNVWVGCELTSTSGTNGAVQEYNSSGTFQKQYLPQCPSNVKGCAAFSGFGYDSGIDSRGNVFASLNLYDIQTCNTSCTDTLGGGFEWWLRGNSSAVPRLISLGTSCSPICGVGFMDVDASDNLWFTFSGYDANQNFGFGLGEITTPTRNPKLTIVEPIGTYGFFGGAYTSGGGNTLNVIDQKSRTISQYHLPLAPKGTPMHVLGPTFLNAFGIGDPVSGAFNSTEKKMAIGDTGGWLDIGNVGTNAWTAVASPNFYSGIEGAAYTPSDK